MVFKVTRGRSGYNSFVDCHDLIVLDKIRYIYPIIYGKDDVPKNNLIGRGVSKGYNTKGCEKEVSELG